MYPALETVRRATLGTLYEGALWLVGGAVRDELLGRPDSADYDIVLESSALDLAQFLYKQGTSQIQPVVYPRFGTAMIRIQDTPVELVTARRESYGEESRKPEVEPATLAEDARRRDFTVNALLKNLHTGELSDPLGIGLSDLKSQTLRTPLDPEATFFDDPLRMLRAVRFRWQLQFEPAPGLYEAIENEASRLEIISAERIQGELVKMLLLGDADRALDDLMKLGLMRYIAPELIPMVGVEQGGYHHLDVWDHTLLVMRNAGEGDLVLTLAALLHDVGKPATRFIDEEGNTRFFGHESLGESLAKTTLQRLKFPNETTDIVALLVRNHMRLGSAPVFTPTAARRLIRDLGPQVERFLELVEADAKSLKPGIRSLDLEPIRQRLAEVEAASPRSSLESPLSGDEIMKIAHIEPGEQVGRIKRGLIEKVLEGELAPGDKVAAERFIREETVTVFEENSEEERCSEPNSLDSRS